MKILYFTRDYSVHDARFLKTIAGAGHQVLLLRLEGLSPLPELTESIQEINWLGTNKPYHYFKNSTYIKALRNIWRTFKPDLVHAGPVHLAGYLAARCDLHPLVTMSWGADLLWNAKKNRCTRQLAAAAIRGSDVFMGDCAAVENEAVELGFNRAKSVIFPWGVDLKHFAAKRDSSIREQLDWQDKFVIFSNRSWEPIYGVEVLVQGFLEAAKTNQDLRMILAGSGSQGEKITKLIKKHSTQDVIFMPGRISQEELPDYYRSADCFISASYCDGSSVSLLEAMACGLPVICSDIAGNLEWINDGVNGWLFRTGDQQDLTSKILEITNLEKSALMEIGKRNRQICDQRADWKSNSSGIFRAYEMAINSVREHTA